MSLPLRSFFVSLLAVPAFAQDATTAAPAAKGPILLVKSTRQDVIGGLSMMLGHMDDLPVLADGSHYELAFGGDKSVAVTTAPGASAFLDLSADPAGLMTTFAEEIKRGRAMVQMGVGMGLQQAGIEPAVAKDIVAGLFDFPQQLDKLTLVITGDPDEVRDKGMDVDLDFFAKADSGFAGVMQKLKPCSQGAPAMVGESLMQMQLSLDPESLRSVLVPATDLILTLTFGAGDEHKAARETYKKWMDLYDGGMAMAFNGNGMDMLIGVLDGKQLSSILASDDYVNMLKAQGNANRNMEMTVQANALEHKGNKFHKMHMEFDGPPNPFAPEGKMDMYQGAVGNYLVAGGEASVKTMADAAGESKIKRSSLAGGAVTTMTIGIEQLVGSMGGDIPDDAPRTMALAIVPKGKNLGVHVHLK
ncbi:MAG: hypothetical protein U1E73_09085 [Planctomycetota bacterium]